MGPDLIYLHGLFGEPRWMAHHEKLSKSFRVIFPDLPGYGRSEEGEVESITDLSFWLRDLLETTKVKRPIILGHSIGGWVGAQFAVLWPNLISKLVLVSPAELRVPGFTPPDVMLIQVPMEMRSYFFADANISKEIFPELQDASQSELEDFYRNYGRSIKLAWDPFLYDPKLIKRLKYLTAPSLVIWGDSDRLLSATHAKLWQENITNSRLEMIQGAGHYCHMENVDEFIDTVRSFVG